MDQPSVKVRLVAMAATLIALLAISIPFVWQRRAEAEPPAQATGPGRAPDTTAADTPACVANAKPANFNFTVKNLEDQDVALGSFNTGKVILLNFWATWCGPCKAEIPGFVELQAKYPDDLVVLGYSVDDDAKTAKAFAEEYKMNYPVLLGHGREDLQDAYGPLWGIPASFIISRDGKVCRKHLGIAPKKLFEDEIKALL